MFKKYRKNVQEAQQDYTRGTRMMKTYVIANQKGGIGKTTTATALATILLEKGHKTLLIDADMQCNSTDTYRAKYEGEATIYDVLFDTDEISDAIQHTEVRPRASSRATMPVTVHYHIHF